MVIFLDKCACATAELSCLQHHRTDRAVAVVMLRLDVYPTLKDFLLLSLLAIRYRHTII